MSNDKKTPEQPSQPTRDSNKGGRGDSVEFAEGYRQLNEVHNAEITGSEAVRVD